MKSEKLVSINEVISILDKAAKVKGEEIKDYISEAKEKVVDISRKTVKTIDDSAHERPWYFVAAAIIPALFLGRWMSSKVQK